jgi:hypothetical protein
VEEVGLFVSLVQQDLGVDALFGSVIASRLFFEVVYPKEVVDQVEEILVPNR